MDDKSTEIAEPKQRAVTTSNGTAAHMNDININATSETGNAGEIFDLLARFAVETCEDIHFLALIALTVEARNKKWHHRTFDALHLALQMNHEAGEPINQEQLVAATLAHDFAMGFLPHELINKTKKLNSKEKKLMQTHINSAADLIHRLRAWDDAKEMILAHHEHIDGSGYPKQLSQYEICDGAKILAIIDAFTAQGHSNIMHGVMEINRYSGSHFSDEWLKHFNSAVKVIYKP